MMSITFIAYSLNYYIYNARIQWRHPTFNFFLGGDIWGTAI